MEKRVSRRQLRFTGMRKGEAKKPGKANAVWFLDSWLPA
jgi:hypothetical protein